MKAALADLLFGQENELINKPGKQHLLCCSNLQVSVVLSCLQRKAFFFPFLFSSLFCCLGCKGKWREENRCVSGMFGYRCSEVWRHGETLGARHLGGVQCCRGSSESRNPDSLASPVPLMLNFFPWRHHQAATKNCCYLAALQTEVSSGR